MPPQPVTRRASLNDICAETWRCQTAQAERWQMGRPKAAEPERGWVPLREGVSGTGRLEGGWCLHSEAAGQDLACTKVENSAPGPPLPSAEPSTCHTTPHHTTPKPLRW